MTVNHSTVTSSKKIHRWGCCVLLAASVCCPRMALSQESFAQEPFSPSGFSQDTFAPQGMVNEPAHLLTNVLGTALLSAVTGYIKGDIRSWRDLGRYTLNGAISGYGFHLSKKAIGQGNADLGVAVGYLSASILENTTLGEHPLAFLRYGAGPVEVRMATPFAKHKQSWLAFDIDVVEVANAAYNLRDAHSIGFRYGAIYGITDQEIGESSAYRVKGRAIGRSMKLHEDFAHPNSSTWRHEAIHGMQALQLSSAFNLGRHYTYEHWDKSTSNTQLVSVGLRGDIVMGATKIANNFMVPYENQWFEREAQDYMQ